MLQTIEKVHAHQLATTTPISSISSMTVDESFTRKAKDVAAGFVGGATQVLIGQPFDLVKIRLQTSTSGATTSSIVSQVLQKEGVLAFYKGTLAPLFGVGACVS
ncbi:hypothetical protein DND62_31325, partial [Pseudomonas syringae pv. pisi]